MNKDNAKEFLPLVQALAEGKVIQFNKGEEDSECWTDYANVSLTLPASRYRIKPEPRKPREFEIGIHYGIDHHGDTACCLSRPNEKLKDCNGAKKVIRVREIIEE